MRIRAGSYGGTKRRVRVDLLEMPYKYNRYIHMQAVNKLDNDALNM